MTAPILVDPETVGGDLQNESHALADRVAVGAIATVEDLAAAVAAREQLGAMRARVVEYFHPIKSMAYTLHKALCAKESAMLKPIDTSDRLIAAAMSAYKADQDRARRDRERAEQDRRQRELDAAALAEAATLESYGDHALAAAVVEDAITAPPVVVVERDPVKDTGAKFRTVWRWRVHDASVVPREFLTLDDTKIGAYVRAMKSSGAIAGIDIYATDEPVR